MYNRILVTRINVISKNKTFDLIILYRLCGFCNIYLARFECNIILFPFNNLTSSGTIEGYLVLRQLWTRHAQAVKRNKIKFVSKIKKYRSHFITFHSIHKF